MRITLAALVTLVVLGGATVVGAGPISEYYITTSDDVGGGAYIHVLQGSSTVRSWTRIDGSDLPIAVLDTVRTTGRAGGGSGREYSLLGAATGPVYPCPGPIVGMLDGTTDGEFNYGLDRMGDYVYRFDLDWSNPKILFDLGGDGGEYIGITFDPLNDSLWLGRLDGSVIENRSMTGAVLSSFDATVGACLALDRADGTLWGVHYSSYYGVPVFKQYSRSGVLLSSQAYPDLEFHHTFGGEFGPAVVPEPSTFVLLAIGVGGLAFARRKRRA